MKPRTRARGIALQVLYEIDLVGHSPTDVLEIQLEESELEDRLKDFSREIVRGVFPLIVQLDSYISQHASEWPLDQIAVVDRNILRIALWELAVDTDTPIKVAINEAVELAKIFGSDSAARFVNGVLGSLADRRNEIRQAIANIHP